MNEIIDGLLYNTETATAICNLVNKNVHYDEPNFMMKDVALYMTNNGRYFIAGHCNIRGNEEIKVVTKDTAQKLTGKYAKVSVYSYFFGEPEAA